MTLPNEAFHARLQAAACRALPHAQRIEGLVRLSAGAGFIVVICGEIMTMPGLPKVPSSEKIFLNEMGQIEGLF